MKLNKSHIEQLAAQKNKEDNKKQLINSIMEMIKTKNIDVDEIGDISKVTLRQNISTDKNGELQTKTNFAVQLSPKWDTGPEWPLVTTAPKPAKQRQKSKTKSQGKGGWETADIIPDIQFGF